MATLTAMNDRRGLSLLGVIIASALLFIVVVTAGRMILIRRFAVSTSREKIVAVNIAREGIELIRSLRDTNWFTDAPWAENLCTPGSTSTVTFTYDSAMARNQDPLGDEANAVLYRSATGEWTHTASGTSTTYSRTLSVDCTNHEANPAFITAVSTVTWGSDSLQIQERLYDWLPEPNPT